MSGICNWGNLKSNGIITKAVVPGSVIDCMTNDGKIVKCVVESMVQNVQTSISEQFYRREHILPDIDIYYGDKYFDFDGQDTFVDDTTLYPVDIFDYTNTVLKTLDGKIVELTSDFDELINVTNTKTLNLFEIAKNSMWLESDILTKIDGVPFPDDWSYNIADVYDDRNLIYGIGIDPYEGGKVKLDDLDNAFSLVDSAKLFKELPMLGYKGNSLYHYVVASFVIDVYGRIPATRLYSKDYQAPLKIIKSKVPFFIIFSDLVMADETDLRFDKALVVFPLNNVQVFCRMDRLWYDVISPNLERLAKGYYSKCLNEVVKYNKTAFGNKHHIAILGDKLTGFWSLVAAIKFVNHDMDDDIDDEDCAWSDDGEKLPYDATCFYRYFEFDDVWKNETAHIHGVPFNTAIKYMKEAKKQGW